MASIEQEILAPESHRLIKPQFYSDVLGRHQKSGWGVKTIHPLRPRLLFGGFINFSSLPEPIN